MSMQTPAKAFAMKVFATMIAAAILVQPMMAAASPCDAACMQAINGGNASGTNSSTLAYPQVSNVTVTTASGVSGWRIIPGQTVTISYTLAAYAANLKVLIKDKNGNVMVTRYDSFQNMGTSSVQWSGTFPSGQALPSGTYTVEVTATSNLGEVSTASASVVVVPTATVAPIFSYVTVNPAAFSAGSSSTIAFTINTAAVVKMDIMPLGYTATTPITYGQEIVTNGQTSTSFSWNGTDKNGNMVPSGDYVILLTGANSNYFVIRKESIRFAATVGSNIATNVLQPTVSIFDVTPNPFNSVMDQATVKFNLDSAADLTFTVKDAQGVVVYTTSRSAINTQAGYNTFVWNGSVSVASDMGANNQWAKDGIYTALITSQNTSGTGSGSRTITVTGNPATVVTSPPVAQPTLSGVNFTPNPFYVQNTTASVSYNLAANAKIVLTIDVPDTENQIFTTTYTQSAGLNSIAYNGRDKFGVLLPTGTYAYSITSYQPTTNAFVDYKYGTFQVINQGVINNTLPTLSGVSFSPNPFNATLNSATISYDIATAGSVAYTISDLNGNTLNASAMVSVSAGHNTVGYNGFNSQTNTWLTSGTYTYKLRSYTVSNVLADTFTGSFQVVNGTVVTATPTLSSVSFGPNPFIPQTQTGTITFNLAANGNVGYQIMDAQGNTVYSAFQVSKSAGLNNIAYAGYNNGGAYLPVGSYTYRVTSYTSANAFADSYTGSFQVVPQTVVVTDTTPYITVNSFSPSTLDVNTGMNANVSFSLQNQGNVVFTVQDANNSTIFTMPGIVSNVYGANQNYSLHYNGVDNGGNRLQTGTYHYTLRANATDGSGKYDVKTGYFYVTNNGGYVQPPLTGDMITSYSFSPTTFDPAYNSATVSFNLQAPTFVVFRVEDTNANTRYEKSLFFGTGYNTFAYNGRDNNGNILPSGTYTYKLIVFKMNGVVEAKQGTFYTSTSGGTSNNGSNPFILSSYATPDPFNPYNGSLTVKYSVTTSAYVSVTIYQDNNIIKSLKLNQSEIGNNSAIWDGRLQNGQVAPAGTYKFRVTAYNSFGASNNAEGSFILTYNNGGSQSICAGFKDVPASSVYCSAVEQMKQLGIFGGYSDGSFRPEASINRAETVKVILAALKYNVPTSGWWFDSAGFKDVNANAWYAPYLAAARLYGIISGYGDNTFRPANTVNRVEMLKIFIEAANIGSKFVQCDTKPYNENTAGKWYSKYACMAKQYSLVDGVNGNLMPGKDMTRGDVAIMIYRAQILGLLGNLPPRTQIDFTKLPAFGSIQSIQMNPIYPGYPTGYNPPPSFLPKY